MIKYKVIKKIFSNHLNLILGLLNSLLESKFPTLNEMYEMSLKIEPRDKK